MNASNPTPDPTMLAVMEDFIAAMKARPPALEPGASTLEATPSSSRESPAAREPIRALECGAVVGRHLVLERLGAGGMGVVYAAYDPELDRKVALKLLLSGAGGDKARTRFLREAQALAKLAHPNIVAIHDVGTLGEQVWLAMEFVQGETLGAWLKMPRGWREVVRVMRSAGKGLAAAHAAGLLHRDFKPDNVMVGDDGRVRVMDFGLARARPEEMSHEVDRSLPQPAVETLAMQITQAGAIVGTPRYMPPEQFGGAEVTATADQFAFCVTLWEALYGERPFCGRTLSEIIANVLGGRRRPPPRGRRIPSPLRRACERGLSVDPQQRWPSMEALLTELRRLVAPRRWLALGVASGLAVVGGGFFQYAEKGFRCTGAEQQLEGIWDEVRKQEVKGAILGTSVSYAPDTWRRVEQRLDEYTKAWIGKHTEVCEATNMREEQSSAVMDLRMACLQERRVALREAVGVLAEATETRVEKAVTLLAGLPELSRCDDVEALQAELPPPEDPEVAEQVEALRERLERVRVLDESGAYGKALVEAKSVAELAEALDYEPLQAEARLWRGRLRHKNGQLDEAELDLEQAYRLALRQAYDEVELDAATELVFVVGIQQGKFDAARRWEEEAWDRAQQYGASARARSWVFNNIGILLAERGELVRSQEYLERALVIKREALGSRHPDVAISLTNLGIVLSIRRNFEQALECQQQALAIWERVLGSRHPNVALALINVGRVLRKQGKPEEALSHHEHALAIHEEAFGLRDPSVAWSLNEIGELLRDQGKLEESLSHHEHALAIREEALGPRHALVAQSLISVAEVALARRDADATREHAERAVSICESSVLSSERPAAGLFPLTPALYARARTLADRARDAYVELVEVEVGRHGK
jgi:tetratricopeptide (TPR) repeat protein/predicted Ser/Thr protein kinase